MLILHRCGVCGSTDLLPISDTLDAWPRNRTHSLTMVEYRCLKCGTITRTVVQRFYDSTDPGWMAYARTLEELKKIPEEGHGHP